MKRKVKSGWYKKILVIMAICFFLPLFSVSCGGEEVAFSGAQVAFGTKAEEIKDITFIIGILITIVLLAVSFFKLCKEEMEDYVQAAGAVGQIIFLIWVNFKLRKEAEGLEFKLKFGFYLYLVTAIALLGVAGYAIYVAKSKTRVHHLKQDYDPPVRNTTVSIPKVNRGIKKVTCPHCGKMVDNVKFCGECGLEMSKKREKPPVMPESHLSNERKNGFRTLDEF